jgi:hypothetical protein
MTGRTSTDPLRAFGTRLAHSIAASRDSTSIRKSREVFVCLHCRTVGYVPDAVAKADGASGVVVLDLNGDLAERVPATRLACPRAAAVSRSWEVLCGR